MKAILLAAGILMILAGVLGDVLGLSSGGGFGFGQFFMCLTGLILTAAGVAGKRFPKLYRDGSVMIMNTLLLILLIEFTAIMVVKVLGVETVAPETLRESVQREQIEETGVIFPQRVFKPFIVWRSVPTELPLMNVDENGLRRTFYTPDTKAGYQVYIMGGSAMWGWMVPDSLTIASFLQKELNESLGTENAEITNLAESGYVSTQELMQLILRLQRGERPSFVIFYDGFNDVLASCENAEAGAVIGQSIIAERFSTPSDEAAGAAPPSLLEFLSGTTTVRVLRGLTSGHDEVEEGPERLVVSHPALHRQDFDLETLAEETAGIYLANYDMVNALSKEMGFEFCFVLQPYLDRSAKPLAPVESEILAAEDTVIVELASLVYSEIMEGAEERPGILSAEAVLNGMEDPVFTDVCHMNPRGNEAVAGMLAGILLERMSVPQPAP